jgi:rod shape-determining protein MreD
MLLFTAAVVQRFFLDQFRIDDVSADAFLALAVATGMVAGSRRGAIVGFAAGLVFDLLVITPFGLGALSYLVAGAVGGLLEGLVVRSARWLTLLVGFLSGAAGVLFYALLGTLVGSTGLLDGHLPAVIVIVSAWTSVLVVPIRSAVRWADPVTDSFRSAIHS